MVRRRNSTNFSRRRRGGRAFNLPAPALDGAGFVEFVVPIQSVAAASPNKITAGTVGVDLTRACRPVRATFQYYGGTNSNDSCQLSLIDPEAATAESVWASGQPVLAGTTGRATASVVNNRSNPFRTHASSDIVLYIRYAGAGFGGNVSPAGILRIWYEYQLNTIG